MSDDRYWIMNPVGHRLWEARAAYGRDGEMVDTVFGEAVLIVGARGEAHDWVCDLCSLPILTRWGDEPFPVPMFGSYALCGEHYDEAQGWPEEDDEGEPIPDSTLGLWPAKACSCQPCRHQLGVWMPQMIAAYRGAAA